MKRSFLLLLAGLPAVIAAAGCEATKSSNPLSPSVAGPIPGVNITAPRLVEPANGSELAADRQPVTLVVENATTSGVRPLRYLFEVATDNGFASKVTWREVPPGEGRTSFTVSQSLTADRTYYWRARAQDGANDGPFVTATFKLVVPVVIEPPVAREPGGGGRVSSSQPTFVIGNSARSGPAGTMHYIIEVSSSSNFGSLVGSFEIPEVSGETRFQLPVALPSDRSIFWRVKAWDGKHESGWSAVQSFLSPVQATPPPPPPPPGGGGGGGNPCGPPYPGDGPNVVACVERRYPERLVPTGNLAQREANMAFLRDRIIETGICGGMDLAWNLKRGVGPHSIDAIAWRHGGVVDVVDIGYAFDGYGQQLRLQWLIVGGTPGYDTYQPRPSCK